VPGIVAVLFLAVSGIVMIREIATTQDITRTNLFQTCMNADKIRTPQEAAVCWADYTRVTGRHAHER